MSRILSSVVFLCGALLLASPARARVWHVSPDGDPAADGASWPAAITVQAALAAAEPGDELWLKEGTYLPAGSADANARFDVSGGLSLFGGFAGNEAERDARDHLARPTILSGDFGQDDERADSPPHDLEVVGVNAAVVVQSIDAIDVVLDGLTIEGADGFTAINAAHSRMVLRNLTVRWNQSDVSGGGLWATDCGSLVIENSVFEFNRGLGSASDGAGMTLDHCGTLRISGCRFSHNRAANEGGAIFAVEPEDLLVANCEFVSHAAFQGAGVAVRGGVARMLGCCFESGRASECGGGLFANGCSSLLVEQTSFVGNGGDRGGGCHVEDCAEARFESVRFVGNSADEGGGGGLLASGAAPQLRDVEFTHNIADEDGGALSVSQTAGTTRVTGALFTGNQPGAIFLFNGGPIEIAHATIAHNSFAPAPVINHFADVSLVNVIVWEPGSIMAVEALGGAVIDDHSNLGEFDPLFANPVPPEAGPDGRWATGDDVLPDLRLRAGSESIDAGTAYPAMPAADLQGLRRALGDATDQGAYEFADDPATIDSDHDGQPDIMESIAGTARDNPASSFALTFAPATQPDAQASVSWLSVRGRLYTIETSLDLLDWTPAAELFATESGQVLSWSQNFDQSVFLRGRALRAGLDRCPKQVP